MNTQCIDHGYRGQTDGYAIARWGGQRVLRHRLAYAQHHNLSLDQISSVVVRHTCDNPRCINPEHLLIGDQSDNMRDKAERRRTGGIKLTNEQVRLIRKVCKPSAKSENRRPNAYSYRALAREFGVTPEAVRSAYLRLTFKHLDAAPLPAAPVHEGGGT